MSNTTMPKAAGEEDLRIRFREWKYGDQWLAALDEALTAERRATIERIRAAADKRMGTDLLLHRQELDFMLDEEENR